MKAEYYIFQGFGGAQLPATIWLPDFGTFYPAEKAKATPLRKTSLRSIGCAKGRFVVCCCGKEVGI